MTIGDRLKALRKKIGLSQEALGAQGFVSAPGWIKIENGQRSPSDSLIGKLTAWLVKDKYMRAAEAERLQGELLTHKYLHSRSPFVRRMVLEYAKPITEPLTFLAAEEPGAYKVTRRCGGPPKKKK